MSRKSFYLLWGLIFGGLSLIFFGLYQKEVEKDLLPSGTESIGYVVSSEEDVSRRPNKRLLWAEIAGNTVLYRKDTLRTGPGSKVLIKLKDSSSIALGENTLVVLETQNDQLSLKLADGDLEVSGNATVSLGNDTKLKAVGGSLRLRRKSSTGEEKVAALSGTAQVESAAGVSIVEQGEVLIKSEEGAFSVSSESIEESGMEKLGAEALAKANSAKELAMTQSLSNLDPKLEINHARGLSTANIAWKAPKEASRYVVRIGEKKIEVLEPKLDIEMQDFKDVYNKPIYVKAFGGGYEGIEQVVEVTKEHKNKVVAISSVPELKVPFNSSRLLLKKKSVNLSWESSASLDKDFENFVVEVRFPDGDVEKFDTEKSSYLLKFDGAGTYTWRVLAEFDEFGKGQSSQLFKFNVIGGAKLGAPVVRPASER